MCVLLVIKYIRRRREAKEGPKPTCCQHRTEPSVEKCLQCKSEQSTATSYRWKIILGLVFPFALQALDATIIASALPWIAGDFGETSQLNWIVSAFNLTSAAFIPFWAQMADVFGRNASLNAAIIFMMIGSALCTGAPTDAFPVLLLGRGFQGLAAAGLGVVVRTIISDRVSLQENAKNWAIFTFVGGISYGLGPVIGGYLVKDNWRWCFGINLPVAAVALVATFFVLRKELLGPQALPELNETVETGRRTKFVARLRTVDVGGQLLFLIGFGLIILGLTWGGATYLWDSAAVLVPLIVGVAFVISFLFWECLMAPGRALARIFPQQRAMIPWAILTNRDVGLVFATQMMTGMAMYSVLYFCNIYFIAVENFTADKAGVQLLYFTPGLGVGAIMSTLLCNTWPRMTFPSIFSGVITGTVGVGLMGLAVFNEDTSMVYGMMALVGVGLGMGLMAGPLHTVGIFRNNRAPVIGLMAITIPFGGTVGLTIMTTVFNNVSKFGADTDFSTLRDLPKDEQQMAVHLAKMGIVWAFVAITPCQLFACCCASLLGNVKLSQERGGSSLGDDSQHVVIPGPYLFPCLRKRTQTSEDEGQVELESAAGSRGSEAPILKPIAS